MNTLDRKIRYWSVLCRSARVASLACLVAGVWNWRWLVAALVTYVAHWAAALVGAGAVLERAGLAGTDPDPAAGEQ